MDRRYFQRFYLRPLAMTPEELAGLNMCGHVAEAHGLVSIIVHGGTTTAFDAVETLIQFLMETNALAVVDLVARQIREYAPGLREAIVDYLGRCLNGPYSTMRGFREIWVAMMMRFQ